MWILLTKQDRGLINCPPALSVHFSKPAPFDRKKLAPWVGADLRKAENAELAAAWDEHDEAAPFAPEVPGALPLNTPAFGGEPNWKGARCIRYEGEDVRLFPHEFTRLSPGFIHDVLPATHYFVASGTAGRLVEEKLKEALFYMQSRGIPKPKARIMLMEGIAEDATKYGFETEDELPPIGWFGCRPEYGVHFADLADLFPAAG